MPYRVKLTRTVAENVVSLHPDIKKRLRSALTDISDHPYAGKSLYADLSGYFSYKFSRYRVIYKPDDSKQRITVYMVGHRRDIYALFSEHLRKRK